MANRLGYMQALKNGASSLAGGLSAQFDIPRQQVHGDLAAEHTNQANAIPPSRSASLTEPMNLRDVPLPDRRSWKRRAERYELSEEDKAALIKLGLDPELATIDCESDLILHRAKSS